VPDVPGADFKLSVEDPYSFYARLRQEEPITFYPELDAWLVTRFEDIQSVLQQPDKFSSSNTLSSMVTFHPRVLEELVKGYLPVPVVLNSDKPEHTRFRMPLVKTLTSARIKSLEPFVREVAHRLVDGFIHQRQVEIIGQFAFPLAFEVVLTLLGIPAQDLELIRKWVYDWITIMSMQLDEEQQQACARSLVSLQHYLVGLIAEHKKAPQDDLLSAMQFFRVPDMEPLTDIELLIMLQALIFAGLETTINMLGNGLQLLLESPERWHRLCDYPEDIPQAIEEILRFESPIQMFARVTTCEVTIGEVTLPEDASLLLVYGSGNRDEAVFACAHEFQLQRSPNSHMAFGRGIHSCVGAALARLEGRVAFETLVRRLPHLRLVPGQSLIHIPSLLFRGYKQLEVEW
jgi:cytochrome P450